MFFQKIVRWFLKLFEHLPDKQEKFVERNNIEESPEVPKLNNFVEPYITETLLKKEVSKPDEIETIANSSDEKEISKTTEVEKIDSKKEKKPYSKKRHSEENNIKVVTADKEEKKKSQQVINLGNTQRRNRKRVPNAIDETETEDVSKSTKINEESKRDDKAFFIKSPFIELNLDEATICFVLPQQMMEKGDINSILEKLSYKIKLNGEEKEFNAKIKQRRNRNSFAEEIQIPIIEPLQEFELTFPEELEDRKFTYKHDKEKCLYVFSPRGDSKAKMEYVYNEKGDKNLLFRKKLWLLLHEDYELQVRPELIDERYLWNSYQLFLLDLQCVEILKIKNRDNTEEEFPTIPTFHIEGKQVEDDFKFECPLFIGNTLKLFAPNENSDGWNVWIQNSFGDFKLQKNWNGIEPLLLYTPDDLPSKYGEFQVDICPQGTRVPDYVLFFRYIPHIHLNYPSKLIFSEQTGGHKTETINVELSKQSSWEINTETSEFVKQINSSVFEISLPPEKDTISFSINKENEDENCLNCKVTIPRLKWKTSKHKSWINTSVNVNREDLIYGEQFNVFIQTNDFNNEYSIIGIVERNSEKIQDGKFVRKGFQYLIGLNQFFDTIKSNFNQLTFKIEIYESESETKSFIKSLDIFRFKSEQTKRKRITAQVKCSCKFGNKTKQGKGFSKKEMKDAGLTKADILKYSILFDKRRKSAYDNNTNLLQRFKNS